MSADHDIGRSAAAANPPGRSALQYRVGTYPTFLSQMLQRMRQPTLTLPDGKMRDNALHALNPDEENAFVPALLSAWATVCDVLSFYQERIANEGYLATATESLSLHELARSVGYRPAPALSATTHLAFTMIEAKGGPTQLLVPQRTAVQSVPSPGETPVTFETDEDIEVRPEWNSLSAMLRPPTVAPQVVGGAKQLIAAGIITTIRPGMPLLLYGRTAEASEELTLVRALTVVESNPTEQTTLLGWDVELKGAAGHPLMEAPEALVFRQSAKLFGANAPAWARQPETVKAQFATRNGAVAVTSADGKDWTPIAAGLPPGEVRALAIANDGMIAAAIGNRVVTLGPGGVWKPAADLPQRSELTALTLAPNGQIYLGTQRGELLSSTDGGATWFNLASPTGAGAKGAAPLPAIPIQTVSVLAVGSDDTKIVVGTALGIWSSAPNGASWTPWNKGLPGYDSKNGGAAAAVNALTRDPARGRWVVSIEQGLFYANRFGGRWHAAVRAPGPGLAATPFSILFQRIRQHLRWPPLPMPAGSAATDAATNPRPAEAATTALASGDPSGIALPDSAQALATLTKDIGATLFAGTKKGVWSSSDGGRSWSPAAAPPAPVGQLAAAGAGLLAGTNQGLFQSIDAGETWTAAPGPFAGTPIAALAAGSGLQVAAAPFGGYPGTEWPDFETVGRQVGLDRTQIDLDRNYETLVPGSWIVLGQLSAGTNPQADFAAARVVAVSTTLRRDYLLNDRVTTVTLDRKLPHPFNPRTATVYLNSRALDAVNPSRHHVDVLGWDSRASNATAEAPLSVSLAGPVGGLKDRLISISGQRAGARFNDSSGGVRKWDGKSWIRLGTFDNDGRVLFVARDGRILLGTNDGVQHLDGEDWVPLGALRGQVNVLAEMGDGEFLAGTESGLWRWNGSAWTASGLADRRVLALLTEDGGRVIAGTDRPDSTAMNPGITYTSTDGGITWTPATGMAAGLVVTALARTGHGLVIAGTDHDGLLIAMAEDWSNAARALPGHTVHALALNAKGRVCAATAAGIFWSDDGLNWPTGRPDRDQGDVRALAFDPGNDELYFAQRGVGVITKGNPLWAGLANDIRSLAFDRAGSLLASSLSSTVLLGAGDNQSAIEPQFVADISGDDLVRRLIPGRLASDLRHIFTENKIALPEKAEVFVLTPGSKTSALKWRISDGTTNYMLHALGSESVRVFVEGDLEVLAWPKPVPGRPELELWRVRNRDNVVAELQAVRPVSTAGHPSSKRSEVVFTGAAASGDTVAEIRKVVDTTITGDRSRTEVSFAEPLENVYDAATVTFNANVAPASHGETPPLYEVIGSGDASVPNQSFTLKGKPITARPSATGSWDYGIAVRVRGSFQSEPLTLNEQLVPEVTEEEAVEWLCVESLILSGPNDPHFVLQENDDGSITLVFGDGKHGRRLPTGTENVIALYRTGSGPTGNVGAGQLTLLRKRPAGVRKVTNPTPASGGTLGQIDTSIRQAAPISVRNLGRIVSLRDYADFVRAWPGIAKVAVRSLSRPMGRRRLVHVTVADANDGIKVASGAQDRPPDGHRDLLDAIIGRRATDCAVALDDYVPRWFRLEADFAAAPGRWNVVNAAVVSMLLDRYGFGRRSLGEPVTAADVTAAIQDVAGVLAVHLKSLYLLDWKPALPGTLHASEAYWDNAAEAVHPAELLLIGGEKNIVLGELKA
jgi:hypothetical protein